MIIDKKNLPSCVAAVVAVLGGVTMVSALAATVH